VQASNQTNKARTHLTQDTHPSLHTPKYKCSAVVYRQHCRTSFNNVLGRCGWFRSALRVLSNPVRGRVGRWRFCAAWFYRCYKSWALHLQWSLPLPSLRIPRRPEAAAA